MALKFKLAMQILGYWSKQYIWLYVDCFDSQLKNARPTKISMPFWSSLDNFLSDEHIIFSKKC